MIIVCFLVVVLRFRRGGLFLFLGLFVVEDRLGRCGL